MSNLSQFVGGNRWITNPKHLPLLSVIQTALNIKGGTVVKTLASAAGFHTTMARDGATAAITVADTYVTVCNLTGAGFLFNAVSPTHTAGFTPTMRITVDGTQYVIAPSANQTLNWRMVLGPTIPGVSIAAPTTASVVSDIPLTNGGWDSGFTNAKIGGIHQYGDSASAFISIPSQPAILALGMAALRFETSLLVEMKASLLSANAVDKSCSVSYRLDV